MKKSLFVIIMAIAILLIKSFFTVNVYASEFNNENDLVEIKTIQYDQRYYYFGDKGHFFIRKIDPGRFKEKKYITLLISRKQGR